MTIVLDTNVLISGLAYPGGILAAWDSRALGLVMSRYQLDEIARVLGYRKIRKLLGWDDARIESYVRQLLLRVELADLSGSGAGGLPVLQVRRLGAGTKPNQPPNASRCNVGVRS